MQIEKNYDFRKKLLTIHEENIRDDSKRPSEDVFVFEYGTYIEIEPNADLVVRTAAEDFADYLKVSMGIEVSVRTFCADAEKGSAIRLMIAGDYDFDLEEADGYKGFCIAVDEKIQIYGKDSRGIAAALYYLEDLMTLEKAPFVKKGHIRKKPMLTPRMVHSGYGMEDYPDNYLARIAHDGRDAILVFTFGLNETRVGYRDFNDLIKRAAKYGIDVYIYSSMISPVYPEGEEAEAYYENLYGKIFKECPGLAGVTLVGEAVGIPSRDPHVSKVLRPGQVKADGIPDGLPRPGWYPCEDFYLLINLIKKIVRKYKPDADIVVWTYNWGYQPEEARIKLINSLPTDITLQATFEMFESWKLGDSIISGADYSLAFPGPGKYFTSEAKAAKERGIQLYTMSQAAGITWDIGVIPYEPMPYQWIKRFEGMREANRKWGLCGGMETHHHGFYPSIITKLSNHAFLEPLEPMDEILDRVLISEYGGEHLESLREGFRLWSDAVCHYPPSDAQMWGVFRVGPSYPFNLFYNAKLPDEEGAMFGAKGVVGSYISDFWDTSKLLTPPTETIWNLRIHDERKSLERMLDLMNQGIAVLVGIPQKNEKLLNVINLGRFIAASVVTAIHSVDWHLLKCKLNAEYTKEGMHRIIDEMEILLLKEIENAKLTIPFVEADSRLGWEPSMCYLTDREHLEWKIRQVRFVLDMEIPKLRKGIEL